MPFVSEKQRRFMHMAHPDIADRWEHGEHSTKGRKGHKMPKRKHARKGGRKA
jgi:hypothetical protein